jgi:hypothetical protein
MRSLPLVVFYSAVALACPVAYAEDKIVALGEIPRITLDNREPTTKKEAARIKSLIKSLAQIENPDFGFSQTLTGDRFLPIVGTENFQSGLIIRSHRIKICAELRELVCLGPKALPFLLDALADTTPTKMKISHESSFGAMWFAHELSGNAANSFEHQILAGKQKEGEEERIVSYVVTVGDVCFVAVGQIVGRPYHAVRYQPTACVVINSPTHDKELREQVQKVWSNSEPDRKVFDSLLLDYSTRGVFNGKTLDGWSVGSNLQCSAVMRLLYYYPSATGHLVAERIAGLDLSELPDGVDAYIKRQVENGVRASDFLKAVNWCEEPVIVKALGEARERATDPKIRELFDSPPKKNKKER